MSDELELRRLAREAKAEHRKLIEQAQSAAQHLANLATAARELARRGGVKDTKRLIDLLDSIDPQLEEIGIDKDPVTWIAAAAAFADDIKLLMGDTTGGEATD